MRSQETIEREMDTARDKLERDLGAFKDVIRDKLDIKAKAQRAVRHQFDRARAGLERARDEGVLLYHRARRAVSERRELRLALMAGMATVLLLGGVVIAIRYRRRYSHLASS